MINLQPDQLSTTDIVLGRGESRTGHHGLDIQNHSVALPNSFYSTLFAVTGPKHRTYTRAENTWIGRLCARSLGLIQQLAPRRHWSDWAGEAAYRPIARAVRQRLGRRDRGVTLGRSTATAPRWCPRGYVCPSHPGSGRGCRSWWSSRFGVQVAPGWCVCRSHPRVDESRRNAGGCGR